MPSSHPVHHRSMLSRRSDTRKVLTNFLWHSSKICIATTSPVFKGDLPSIANEKKSQGSWGSGQNTKIFRRGLAVFATGTSWHKQYCFSFSS